jgi:addiction module HigA family antidote
MKMHNPPHPGEVLRTLCLEPLNMTVTEVASALGVSRKTLSAILNVSPSPSIPAPKAG